jgi:putative tryptophan/tyrosine transport system substrate-binding protein
MRRRAFIAGLGCAAACPVAIRAQQRERMRRVGILMPYPRSDVESRAYVEALRQDLRKLGWVEGRTIRFDEYWTTDDMDLVRKEAAELIQSKPDVVVATGGRVLPILKQMTQTIPIVFAGTADPVGAGLVDSLARPGGNLTGLSVYEFSVIGKSLDILTKIAPAVSRVALIFNPDNPTTRFFVGSFEDSAGKLGIQPVIAPIHGLPEIDKAIATLAKESNGGLMFAPDVTIAALHDEIVATVARYRLPAVYSEPLLVRSGGLVSYSSDRIDMFRRAAAYIDRILRGESPSDLPVQEPLKYVLAINLKTAGTLGIVVPPTLLAIADEVIE